MTIATSHLFSDLFSFADTVVTKWIVEGAATIADELKGVAFTLVTIYVVLYGVAMVTGKINEQIMDGVARIVKVSFIVALATNSALYADHISNFLYEWPSAMAGKMIGGGSGATDTAEVIDRIFATGLDTVVQAWQTATWRNPGSYLIAGLLFVFAVTITAICAVLIISSKFGLALLLALGPLFFLMLLFEGTKKLFDQWLGSVITSGLAMLMISMGAVFTFKIFGGAFDAASANAAINGGMVSLTDIAPVAVYGLISGYFLLQIPGLAGNVGGGISTASTQALGAAYDKLKPERSQKNQKDQREKEAQKNGRFARGQGQGGNIRNGRSAAPMAVYRKITSSSSRSSRPAA
jgi:type IV secretion system protein VirB6